MSGPEQPERAEWIAPRLDRLAAVESEKGFSFIEDSFTAPDGSGGHVTVRQGPQS